MLNLDCKFEQLLEPLQFFPVLSSPPLYGLINMMRDKKTVIFAYFYG